MQNKLENKSPLSETQVGEIVDLVEFPKSSTLVNRLTSLGLTPGVEIRVLQNFGWGPILINVRGTHIALGRGEAAKLFVTRQV
jgi:ferrous iron transport protein A